MRGFCRFLLCESIPEAERRQGIERIGRRAGTVKGEQIILDNGTELTQDLKQGAKIKMTYEEQGGRKVVNSLQIMAGPQAK